MPDVDLPENNLSPPAAAPDASAAPPPEAPPAEAAAPAAEAPPPETHEETPAGAAVAPPAAEAPPEEVPASELPTLQVAAVPPPDWEVPPPEAAGETADEAEAEAGEEEPAAAPAEAPAAEEAAPPSNKRWYVVKVQSGREESIREAIERRVKIERLEEYFGQILIPTERVTEMRNGKRVVKERKLYPGYLMAEVEYNDRILYLFRETSGVGDFVGGTITRPPPPMSDREVQKMIGRPKEGAEKVVAAKPQFSLGDRVKVRDGTFAGMEGEVKEILEALQHVRVELTIFGRPVPVELEYWQVETV
jgi:transcriptional antiterminator NusG